MVKGKPGAVSRAAGETQLRRSGYAAGLDVWTRQAPGGRRPRFTREQIAAAAVRIADAEGYEGLSMRRLATELGAGTMTLYHYVRTKDELLALVTDAVMGEVVVPPEDPLPGDWRHAVTAIAVRARATLRRHPWALDLPDDPAVGPNSVAHFDQALAALAGLDVDLAAKLDLVSAVDAFVFGHCLRERGGVPGEPAGGYGALLAYLERLVSSGRYPQLAALAAEHGVAGAWLTVAVHLRDEAGFERNLTRLLDGFAAAFERGAVVPPRA